MYTALPNTLKVTRFINEVLLYSDSTVEFIPSDNLSIYDGPMPVYSGLTLIDDDLILIYNGLMAIYDGLKLV